LQGILLEVVKGIVGQYRCTVTIAGHDLTCRNNTNEYTKDASSLQHLRCCGCKQDWSQSWGTNGNWMLKGFAQCSKYCTCRVDLKNRPAIFPRAHLDNNLLAEMKRQFGDRRYYPELKLSRLALRITTYLAQEDSGDRFCCQQLELIYGPTQSRWTMPRNWSLCHGNDYVLNNAG